jgi:hypothetical protein
MLFCFYITSSLLLWSRNKVIFYCFCIDVEELNPYAHVYLIQAGRMISNVIPWILCPLIIAQSCVPSIMSTPKNNQYNFFVSTFLAQSIWLKTFTSKFYFRISFFSIIHTLTERKFNFKIINFWSFSVDRIIQ